MYHVIKKGDIFTNTLSVLVLVVSILNSQIDECSCFGSFSKNKITLISADTAFPRYIPPHASIEKPSLSGSRSNTVLLSSSSSTTTTSSSNMPDTERVKLPSDDNKRMLLDEALDSNITSVSLLLEQISSFRQKPQMKEYESFLDDLLSYVNDEYQKSPLWTKLRFLTKTSKRARRASLYRLLKLTMSSDEEDVDDDDNKNEDVQVQLVKLELMKRLQRSAFVVILRNIQSELTDNTSNNPTTKNKTPIISQLERIARRESKRNTKSRFRLKKYNNINTRDEIESRLPKGLETPNYSIVTQRKTYEIRKYDSYSICSVPMVAAVVDSTTSSSNNNKKNSKPGGSSFNALASYLFGKNQQQQSMKMTTPVFTTSTTTTTTDSNLQRQMSFVLPSTYWNENELQTNAPKPLSDSPVTLQYCQGRYYAVALFGGFASKRIVEDMKRMLLRSVENDREWDVEGGGNGQDDISLVMLAQYNDPFTAPWKRRNEVLVPVIPKEKK